MGNDRGPAAFPIERKRGQMKAQDDMAAAAGPALPQRLARIFIICAMVLLAPVVLLSSMGWAADPVAYDVTIAPSGDAGIDTRLHDASTLISLRETAPVG